MPRGKRPEQDGVGQLAFTFVIPEEVPGAKDGTGETQGDGPEASTQPAAARNEPEPAKQRDPKGPRKWHSLIDKVYALPNLQSAWERVRANRGARGSDGMTVQKYSENADGRLQRLSQELRAKTYRPKPVRRVFIPKSGGGQRPLGIPTIEDRIVQQALLQVLEPIFEGKFSNRSHGFRRGRGCASALETVDRAVRHGYGWVVDADLQSFFDTVDHERLLDAVNEEVADGSVLKLIRLILRAGVSMPDTAEIEPTSLGTPQGGPVSPLLANIYLHALDVALTQAGYGLVRYADDFVIFAKSESEANGALVLAREILEGQLGLRLHPEKTRVVSVAQGFEFLGFHYSADPKRGTLRKEVRRKSVARFREIIRSLTPRLKNQKKPKERHITPARLAKNQRLQELLKGLERYLEGWHWYFKRIWTYRSYYIPFDQFVRRRVRTAITGRTGSGWWNRRIPNRMLAQLGLPSLVELNETYRADPWDVPAREGGPGGEPYAGKPHVRFG